MGEDEENENGRNGGWRGGSHGGGFHHSEPVAAAAASGGGSRQQQQQQQQQPISQILSCCDGTDVLTPPMTVMNSEKMRSVELPCYNKSPPIPRDRNGVSIAERRARLGFDASKINTARFRTTSPLTSPSARSPFITIPPGLSPTSLLDSPVMLHNSQAQPSPTTGTYPLPFPCHKSSVPISASEVERCNDFESSSMFKPHANPIPMQCFPGPESQAKDLVMTDVNSQVMAALQPQVEHDSSAGFWKQTMPKFYNSSPLNFDASSNVNSKFIPLQASQSSDASHKTPQYEEQVHGEDLMSRQLLEGDQKGAYISTGMGRPSEDGYNWRKYGQKQVKGSEYPRSYYKCTSPNCPVKKKIERSRDGQITEIIIDGSHNHPKPQPSRRSAMGSAFAQTEISETGDAPGLHENSEGGLVWRGLPQESIHNKVGSDWRTDGLERTSSTSVVTDLSDQLSTAQAKHLGILESADTPELSSTLASHDEDEDRATQGSVSLGDDADDVESEAKRRKKDSCLMETSLASRAVREPRVVVQTDSEVDILDDGYRWRKYGQKVVKGNPNPRSYYKCTSAGCTVRKHVERASHDLKFVITTYEGKHNHEVPAARNNNNSSGGNASASNSNAQSSLSLPRTASIPKPEAQVQDLVPRFERKPEFSNDFFRPNNLGGYANDMKFGGAPAYYGMKLPPFQPTMPCGPFGLNQNPNEVHRVAPIAQGLPDFPMSLPLNFPLPPNLDFGSYNFNSHGKPVVSAQSYLGAQQAKEEDMKIIRPKQELKDDAGFETNNLYNAGFTL